VVTKLGLSGLHILSILACRKRQNREAKEFLKKQKKNVSDVHLRNHFNFDQKEEVLESNKKKYFVFSIFLKSLNVWEKGRFM
jgi:hypothetical protein